MKLAAVPFVLLALVTVGCGAPRTSQLHAATTPGVIPEFAPSRAVLVDQSVFLDDVDEGVELVKAIVGSGVELWISGNNQAGLAQKLDQAGAGTIDFLFFTTGHSQNPWVRDYGPMSTRTASGAAFLDFDYAQEDGDEADNYPSKIGQALGMPVVNTSIKLDGGNLTCDFELCLVSHYSPAAITDDDEDDDEPSAVDLTQAQLDALGQALGRTVHAVGKLPYEATGHIDLWAKIVGPRKILVAELAATDLLQVYPQGAPGWVKKVKKFYDAEAAQLVELGFDVARMPSPVPDKAFELPRFRSYLNALQIGTRMIVPRYVKDRQDDPESAPYIDAALLSSYEARAEQTLASLGFDVSWATSDYAILGDGAVHCHTLQIAQ